nr:MAG TPA: hypothetical protein [Caudoviricetes sp.]
MGISLTTKRIDVIILIGLLNPRPSSKLPLSRGSVSYCQFVNPELLGLIIVLLSRIVNR